jgi:hypothetical protein
MAAVMVMFLTFLTMLIFILLALGSHQLIKEFESKPQVIVHKLDRLSRNTFNYLVLKSKLRSYGVRIYSVVETIEDSPMGEFMEHIMAAQAEFYSANLSSETKKGLEERLLRGKWNGLPPLGYLLQADRVVLDPARAQFIRRAFELWSQGDMTTEQVAEKTYGEGLVGRSGNKIRASYFCALLKNPFYTGLMVVNGKTYPGVHPPLVTRELFERAQEIFRQKRSAGRTRQHLTFLLARKVHCPSCASILAGEQHEKKSGKIFRYYRCHQKSCGYSTRAEELEQEVKTALLNLHLPERLIPELKKRLREKAKHQDVQQAERTKQLRQERKNLEQELRALAMNYAERKLDTDEYERQLKLVKETIRATEWLLASRGDESEGGEQVLLQSLKTTEKTLRGTDVIAQRQAVEMLVEGIEIRDEVPMIFLKNEVKD